MSMEFTFKEIFVEGEKKLLFQEASGITPESRLPRKYRTDRNHCRVLKYKYSDIINFYKEDGDRISLKPGEYYDEDTVEECISIAKKAGEWLKHVLDEIREAKKTWNKTRKYVI